MPKRPYSFRWLMTMAWRDSRKNRSKLALFVTAIVVGIAVLVAINGFRNNIERDIQAESQELLGADLQFRSYYEPHPEIQALIDSIPGEKSHSLAFASMVRFPKTNDTRLVQVRALEGNYPFYGSLTTEPAAAADTFQRGPYALVDEGVMIQYDLEPGDSIAIGTVTLPIVARLQALPGTPGVVTTISPKVYIPLRYLEATGLVQKGSRIFYRYYFKLDPTADIKALTKSIEPTLDEHGYRYQTATDYQDNVGENFGDLANFLNLVGFIALLLGCIGVTGTVQVYLRSKRETIATLRCLGLKGRDALVIFFVQVMGMSLIGAVVGALLGTLLQTGLPYIMSDLLPIDTAFTPSGEAIGGGILTGLVMAGLFAMIPLLEIRHISPLAALRVVSDSSKVKRDVWRYVVFIAMLAFIFGFTWWQMKDLEAAFFFSGILAGGFLLLTAVGYGTMWLIRKFFPSRWPFTWRQALANLYRPQNQTLILLVTLGLGTALIGTLSFTQSMLLNEINLADQGDQPNMILFDIQPSQKEGVRIFVEERNLPIVQNVPIVTLRLEGINGRSRTSFLADSTSEIGDWVFNREYRVTYRDTLIDTEELVEGELQYSLKDGLPRITLSEDGAEDMHVDIGDTLAFDLQGISLDVVVGGIRKVNWRRVQTNFTVVFPSGVLEKAPQFYVLVTRTSNDSINAAFQQQLVRKYPNVSVIDLKLILETAADVIGKVSFVIQFMALFSVLTGLLILISAIYLSKYQRIKESVLLRTLGAQTRQVLWINVLEYGFLGLLSSTIGILIALVASFLLASYSFEIVFAPPVLPIVIILLAIPVLTMVIGLLNTRQLLNQPPLAVLRAEE